VWNAYDPEMGNTFDPKLILVGNNYDPRHIQKNTIKFLKNNLLLI